MHKGKLIAGGILAMAAVGVVVSAEDGAHATRIAPAHGTSLATTEAVPTSEASTFRLWVEQEGTAAERAAARHVTRLTAHTGNQRVEIYTDWDSRFASRYSSQAGQIAAAYRAWQSGTGHAQVIVHASNGQAIATRRF
ncbi:hypothetical protein GCM10023100_22030 [Actinocorallia cavernae]|uniref:Uncharacterized protein n=2 Tax=Actinomycetes TaxID=1760 RepID=A0ABP8SK92_9ACTN